MTSLKVAGNNEIAAIRPIRVCFWYRDACVFYTSLKGPVKKNATFEVSYSTKSDV